MPASGAVDIATPANLVAPVYPGVSDSTTRTLTAGFFRIDGGIVSGTIYGGRHVFATPQNLSNQVLAFTIGASSLAAVSTITSLSVADGVMIAIFDNLGNYRRWNLISGNSQGVNLNTASPVRPFSIECSCTTTMQEQSATPPNLANIVAFEIHQKRQGTSPTGIRMGNLYKIDKSTPIQLTGTNPTIADFATYEESQTKLYFIEYRTASIISTTVPIGIAASSLSLDGSTIIYAAGATITDPRCHLEAAYFAVNQPAAGTFSLKGAQIKSPAQNISAISTYGAGASGLYNGNVFSNLRNKTLVANETYLSCFFLAFNQLTINGATTQRCTLSGGAANPSVILQTGANLGIQAESLAGAIRVDFAAGDYAASQVAVSNGQTIQLNGGGGAYDLSGFTGGTVGSPVVFDAIDGNSYTITVGSGITAIAKTPQTNGSVSIIKPQFIISGFPTGANINGVPYEAVLGIRNTSDNTLYTADASTGSVVAPLSSIGDGIGPFLVWGDGHGVRRTISVSVPATRLDELDLSEFFEEFTAEDGTVLVGLAPADTGVTYEQSTALFLFSVAVHKFLGVLSQFDSITSTQAGQAYDNDSVRAIEFVSNAFANTIFLPTPFRIAAVENAVSSPALADFRVIRPDLGDARAYGLSSTLYAERPIVGFPYAYVVSALTSTQAGQLEALHGTLQSSGETTEAFTSVALAAGGGGGGLGPEDIARLERIEQQLTADIKKGATRYQRLLAGTDTVILDQDVVYDPETGFTLTEHQEAPP